MAVLRARSVLAVMLLLGGLLGPAVAPARAGMTLSKVIVDFSANQPSRDDIEITNVGDEVLYVSVEPFEIIEPGRPDEQRVTDPDPRVLGLLVSPNRLALGPGERKIVRFSLLERPAEVDRIYRVAIQPVVGELSAQRSALKVVVGYDVLVIARPLQGRPVLSVSRDGPGLEVRNLGNTNALLFEGRQCDADETACVDLPSKRIYPGTSWQVQLPGPGPARFLLGSGSGTTIVTY